MTGSEERDPVVTALRNVRQALQANNETNNQAMERVDVILQMRARGSSWAEIVAAEERPLVVEMTRDTINRAVESGSVLRRVEAKALHDDGMTMDAIAELFGVTRQRISALIRDGSDIGRAGNGIDSETNLLAAGPPADTRS